LQADFDHYELPVLAICHFGYELMPFPCPSWTGVGQDAFNFTQSLTGKGLEELLHSLNHILNHLLSITKHHHGFVHVEEFVD
jgi:hypothetical protein